MKKSDTKQVGSRRLSDKEIYLLAEKLLRLTLTAAEGMVQRLPINIIEQQLETTRLLGCLSRLLCHQSRNRERENMKEGGQT